MKFHIFPFIGFISSANWYFLLFLRTFLHRGHERVYISSCNVCAYWKRFLQFQIISLVITESRERELQSMRSSRYQFEPSAYLVKQSNLFVSLVVITDHGSSRSLRWKECNKRTIRSMSIARHFTIESDNSYPPPISSMKITSSCLSSILF